MLLKVPSTLALWQTARRPNSSTVVYTITLGGRASVESFESEASRILEMEEEIEVSMD